MTATVQQLGNECELCAAMFRVAVRKGMDPPARWLIDAALAEADQALREQPDATYRSFSWEEDRPLRNVVDELRAIVNPGTAPRTN